MKKIIAMFFVGLMLLTSLSVCFAADDEDGKVNLNTATKEQLLEVGVDEGIADGILEMREENESFVDIEELMDVDGMTPKMLRQLKKVLFVKEVAGCNC